MGTVERCWRIGRECGAVWGLLALHSSRSVVNLMREATRSQQGELGSVSEVGCSNCSSKAPLLVSWFIVLYQFALSVNELKRKASLNFC